MLVLSRRLGEVIRIGKDVEIMVVKIDRRTVRLGIEAPKAVQIVREEVKQGAATRYLKGDHA